MSTSNKSDFFLNVFFIFINFRPRTGRNSNNEINSTSGQLHSNSLNILSFIGDRQRLFHSYVLLERLSPNVIQNLL